MAEAVLYEDKEEAVEKKVVELLKKHGLKVSTAESCTGGLVAATIINVSGASAVISEAYVTYCDAAKHKLVGVSEETLEKYSAVSKETAYEMAAGCARAAECEAAISVTGVAGPFADGDKPAGLVYIGCCLDGEVRVTENHFPGDRDNVRHCAVNESLDMLRRMIIEKYE